MVLVWSFHQAIYIMVIASYFSLSFIQQRFIRANKLIRNQHVVSLSTIAGSAIDNSQVSTLITDDPATSKKFIKRKVALVFSYVGSAYNGLQFDSTHTFTTVESVVQKALFDVGCIKPTNFDDLTKISWSRSSRTDKGVHCARLVISAKLELDDEWLLDDKVNPGVDKGVISNLESQKVRTLPTLVNALLPSDIRLISCIRLTQSFRARQACYWREYEYLLPLQPLLAYKPQQIPGNITTTTKFSRAEILSRLDFALRKLEGSKSYHNFHRIKRRDLIHDSRKRNCRDTNDNSNIHASTKSSVNHDEDGDEEGEAEEEEEEEEVKIDTFQRSRDNYSNTELSAAGITPASLPMTNLFQRWTPLQRDVVSKTQGSIYCCDVLNVEEVAGVEMVRIRVRGKSFLLHQIRVIIGSAIFYAHDMLPESVLDAALLVPLHIPLPMAPAEGLILADSGYMQNLKPKTVLWTLCPAKYTVIASRREGSFLNDTEYDATEKFKRSLIYTQVAREWGLVAAAEKSSLSNTSCINSSSGQENGGIVTEAIKVNNSTSSTTPDVLSEWLAFNEERYSMGYNSNININTSMDINHNNNTNTNNSSTANAIDSTPTPQEEVFWQNLIRQYVTENEAVKSVQDRKVEKELLRRMRFIRIFNDNSSNSSSGSNNNNSSNNRNSNSSSSNSSNDNKIYIRGNNSTTINTTNISNNSGSNSSIASDTKMKYANSHNTTTNTTTNNSNSTSKWNKKVKPAPPMEFDYQDFLPTGMNTALTVVTRVNPGNDVNQGLRALAYLLTKGCYDNNGHPSSHLNNLNSSSSSGDDNKTVRSTATLSTESSQQQHHTDISLNWDCDELAAYVQKRGGLSWLLSLPVHPLIN